MQRHARLGAGAGRHHSAPGLVACEDGRGGVTGEIAHARPQAVCADQAQRGERAADAVARGQPDRDALGVLADFIDRVDCPSICLVDLADAFCLESVCTICGRVHDDTPSALSGSMRVA